MVVVVKGRAGHKQLAPRMTHGVRKALLRGVLYKRKRYAHITTSILLKHTREEGEEGERERWGRNTVRTKCGHHPVQEAGRDLVDLATQLQHEREAK